MDELNLKTRIFFVRHGHVRNPLNVYYGRLFGFPISAIGRQQALEAAYYLKDQSIDAVYSSPQLRACETAHTIIEPHQHLILRISESINEVHCPFDGQPIEKLAERNWDLYTGVGPGFEQPGDVLARARQFVAHTQIGHCGQNIVAVSHGDLIAFLILWAHGLSYTLKKREMLYQEYVIPGSIHIFEFDTLKGDETSAVKYVSGAFPNIDEVPYDLSRD
ncbi:MAG: histidine phosphatase family protein [Anaerolineales bacterium]